MTHFIKHFLIASSLLVGFLAVMPKAQAANFYLPDDSITIDNDTSEWGDPIITDSVATGNRTQYCWNTTTLVWDETTDPSDCTTYVYDPDGQIDLTEAWFGVNETNMLLAFTTATPMFGIYDVAADSYVGMTDEALLTAGVTALPEPFAHDMVFAFDSTPNQDNAKFDWYMVANINYDIGGENVSAEGFLEIYQDSGETNGFQADEDILAGEIDTTQSEVADFETSATMEIRQNIEYFYEVTGIQSGDDVDFRLETHSDAGDTTKTVHVKFDDFEGTITEDAVVLGGGATKFNGREASRWPRGVVTAYTADDQTQLLEFTAYQKKVGVQVAVGDVDGDGSDEIVTLPFKKTTHPELKVFNLAGELEANAVIPRGDDMRRLQQYFLAVGNVNGTGKDEIVLSSAQGNQFLLDVIELTAAGALNRLVQYEDDTVVGYGNGVWVEVADVVPTTANDSTNYEEIVTAPVRGSAVVDIWNYAEDDTGANGSINYMVKFTELDTAQMQSGVHIAATNNGLVMVPHRSGRVTFLEWVEAKGNLATTGDTFAIGHIGNAAYNGTTLVYSSFTKKQVVAKNSSGDTQYTITTDSRGGFVDFVDVE